MHSHEWGRSLFLIRVFSVFTFLALWELGSRWMGSSIILPSPAETLVETWALLGKAEFYRSMEATLFRGVVGFLLSLGAGLFVGVLAGKSFLMREFFKPFLISIQSTPVLAIILLALIWFPTETVPIFVAFLMGFPIITRNVTEGIQSLDHRLLEMAEVFRIERWRRALYVVLPSILPHLVGGASSALGLSWRVVVASEVLSQPFWGIGTGLQEAKLRLDTSRVFAWTLTALVLSYTTETVFRWIVRRLKRWA
ncbi:MAG: ABC transporter permease subunit [Spirochaetales bacterium]